MESNNIWAEEGQPHPSASGGMWGRLTTAPLFIDSRGLGFALSVHFAHCSLGFNERL